MKSQQISINNVNVNVYIYYYIEDKYNKKSLTQIQEVSQKVQPLTNNELFIYKTYMQYITLELCVELLKSLTIQIFQEVVLPLIVSLLA